MIDKKVTIFGLSFHLYGFLIALGILASAKASAWLAKKRNYSENIIWDGLWWPVVPAIVGARLYHVVDRWGDIYSIDPVKILYVWNGGLGIIGGLIGGLIGLYLYWRFRLTAYRLPLTALLDLVFFGLPLGQAIGRFGNFFNQEVYGLPSSLPYSIFIDPDHRVSGFEQFSTFHPLFAYEGLWCLLGFGIMFAAIWKRSDLGRSDLFRIVRNSLTGFYLIWYGTGRFFLEFLRIPEFSWRIVGVDMAQVFSVLMIAGGIMTWRKSFYE